MHRLRTSAVVALATSLLLTAGPFAQVKEYDWYTSFRSWMQSSVPVTQRGVDSLTKLYREKLATDGVTPDEVERRITLLRTKPQELENDFWNRFFTVNKPNFNTEPNAFLAFDQRRKAKGRREKAR